MKIKSIFHRVKDFRWKLKKIKVYALVGKSGTGKSFRARLIMEKYGIDLMIDDGLLIRDQRIIAGRSAKREKNKVTALKRAIFEYLKDAREMRNTLEKEKFNHMKFANEGIISQLFPIVDNFDMALGAMDKAKDKAAVMDGIKLVQKEFHRILDENGVKKIETVGKTFDPNIHEAVSVVKTDECPDDEIIEEVRPGSIILLHVMYAGRRETMEAVPAIIDELRQRGYWFVTVSELLMYGER